MKYSKHTHTHAHAHLRKTNEKVKCAIPHQECYVGGVLISLSRP